ncbi:hypothetical protein V8C34DRAFT_292964 [Trichoderma compactum]
MLPRSSLLAAYLSISISISISISRLFLIHSSFAATLRQVSAAKPSHTHCGESACMHPPALPLRIVDASADTSFGLLLSLSVGDLKRRLRAEVSGSLLHKSTPGKAPGPPPLQKAG